MDWDDLQYVLCLDAESTLSATSRRLRVSHTTVARRIAALEQTLGARLFDKTPRGYVPTVAGEEVLEVARSVNTQIQTLDRQVLGRDRRLSGRLRVTTLDLIATHLAPELGAFSSQYPEVELEITTDNRPQSLTRREADVAIRMSNRPPPHLVGRKLGRVEYAAYASVDLIESREDPTNLRSYPWLGWRVGESAPLTEAFLAAHIPGVRHSYRVGSALSMLAAVRAGIGVSFLGCFYADQIEGIRRVRDVEPGFGVDLWLLIHADLRRTARIRAFMEHMATAIEPHLERMAGRRPLAPALTPASKPETRR